MHIPEIGARLLITAVPENLVPLIFFFFSLRSIGAYLADVRMCSDVLVAEGTARPSSWHPSMVYRKISGDMKEGALPLGSTTHDKEIRQ